MQYSVLKRQQREWTIALVGDVRLRLTLQPSGAVLIEGRIYDKWFSCYERDIHYDQCLNNRMYGRRDSYRLLASDVAFIQECGNEMRDVYHDFWDERYAPGPDFTGG